MSNSKIKKLNPERAKFLRQEAKKIRKTVLDISYRAGVGHISSALCIVDILTVLYNEILNINPKQPLNLFRDRFILSKGHAALALYSVLHRKGFISRKKLKTFCQNGKNLGMHPEYNPKMGIELSTGSLGYGLPIGCGLAFGLRASSRIFVLISDAELNAGSTWEAAMFAAHHNLENLTAIIDDNGLQAFGTTRDVLNLSPIRKKWQAFGWGLEECDGHDIIKLYKTFARLPFACGHPSVIIAKTIGGKGVSFMENKIDWHYWPLNKKLYKQALEEIEEL